MRRARLYLAIMGCAAVLAALPWLVDLVWPALALAGLLWAVVAVLAARDARAGIRRESGVDQ